MIKIPPVLLPTVTQFTDRVVTEYNLYPDSPAGTVMVGGISADDFVFTETSCLRSDQSV